MNDGAIVEGGVAAQTTQTMANVADRLAEAGRHAAATSSRRCASSPTWARSPSSTRPTPTRSATTARPARRSRCRRCPAGWPSRSRPGRTSRAVTRDDGERALQLVGERRPGSTSPTTTPSGACPQRDPRRLFEFVHPRGRPGRAVVVDDPAQARRATAPRFAGFDPARVAAFDDDDVARCLADPGIVRNRAKVDRGDRQRPGLARARRPGRRSCGPSSTASPVQNHWTALGEVPATTAASRRDEQGAQEARLPLRRPDDLLRPDAGLRPRQRPRHRLLPPRRVRRG